ncbi:Pam16-domain-containing protein [Polychytrium aggregatum]|uniref:Pam16-domain-containing protein n=1 Tax=Polychytrium aggregatum TaxID=110093 RepID=UPI0022FF28B0|nr:Pam16-domain-containing protein [Polychytrium aggregatum]KAI9202139.1 Pam16-domain-containing protein [Polychytrium aggregatum]
MAARVITQIVIVGSQILGKAFVEAFREASKKGAVAGASGARSAADVATRKTGMSLDEAQQILAVRKENLTMEEVMKKYDHLFKANDPASGGTFYLQSKIVRAKERIEMDFNKSTPDSTPSN